MKLQIVAPVAIVSVVLLAVVLYATGGDTTNTLTDIPQDDSAAIPQDDLIAIPQHIADANNSFAVDFYKKIIQADANSNQFFSPTSIYIAFSALYEGAEGNTAFQMEDVFGFEPDSQERHMLLGNTITSLNRDDPSATLKMANALWPSKHYTLYDSYITTLQDTYQAHVENLDFTSDDSVDTINQWASDNTNEKITTVYKKSNTPELVVAVLTNAIYFKGDWLTAFPKEATVENDFWTGTDNVRAEFMTLWPSAFDYVHVDNVQVLQMPYKGERLSMLLILPSDKDGMGDLEDSLSYDLIREWQDGLQNMDVNVNIPKFDMRTNYDLSYILEDMGMPDVFTASDSNLPNIVVSPPDLNKFFVSKATQDAFVNVNEEGTEAATVTTIEVMFVDVPEIPYFVADHPFIFIIQDNESGTILFMGKITDPTVKSVV